MSAAPSDRSLASWREEFPALSRSTYMVSHSLGAMPRRTEANLAEFARLWVDKGITAWDDWIPEIAAAASRVARIINAPDGTMTMATNVSQIQALLASCLEYRPGKNKIVYSELEFPTVSYVWYEERRRGAQVTVVPSRDGIHIDIDRFLETIDETTVAVPLSHVLFRSSTITEVARVVARAKEVDALVILDCYQSTGAIPVDVQALGVDFACGGSVKWLCGGPGAGYLYVRPDRIPQFSPRNTGWFGHEKPFAFTMPEQRYAGSIWRYTAGTPAIVALYQARGGAEIVSEIGVARIRANSLRMTQKIIWACDQAGYTVNTPREPERRGGTICFDFVGADKVTVQLNKLGFFCDHRPGCGIRISPHFYSTDEEVQRFLDETARLKKELA
jgi:kynureninase